MWLNLVIFGVLVCIGSGKYIDYAVGDPCEASDGGQGECTFLSRCEYGVKLVLNYGFHNLTRCGFEENTEIVCCVQNYGDRFGPTTSGRPGSTTTPVAHPLAAAMIGLPVIHKAPQSRPTPERAEKVQFMDATGDSGGPLRPAPKQKVTEIDYAVGDQCAASNGGMGECTFLSRCEYGVDLVLNNGFHNLTRCGFVENTEIVCCVQNYGDRFGPITSERPASTTRPVARPGYSRPKQRVAERECQKILSRVLPPFEQHIVGGSEAADAEFPYMAALGYLKSNNHKLRFACGGSLISEKYVLTAGHCIVPPARSNLTLSIVRIGVLNITGPYNLLTDYNVSRSVIHPDFKERYNDIALVELDHPVALSATVYPGCLYVRLEDPVGRLIATGWGATSINAGGESSVLLKTDLNFVPHAQCVEKFPYVPRALQRGIIESMVCAVGENGKDTCRGDSGGPLQALTERDGHYRILGITSFGIDCSTEVPAVYSRVVSFLDWIEATVWPDQN